MDEVDRVLWVLVQLQRAGWGVAYLSTCTSPLFPHSLSISSLPQTFHSLPLRPIDGLGNNRQCLRLVVVDVKARQSEDFVALIAFRTEKFQPCLLSSSP